MNSTWDLVKFQLPHGTVLISKWKCLPINPRTLGHDPNYIELLAFQIDSLRINSKNICLLFFQKGVRQIGFWLGTIFYWFDISEIELESRNQRWAREMIILCCPRILEWVREMIRIVDKLSKVLSQEFTWYIQKIIKPFTSACGSSWDDSDPKSTLSKNGITSSYGKWNFTVVYWHLHLK